MKEIKNLAELEEILNNDKGLVCLKFGAPWCGPCRMLESTIQSIEGTIEDVTFYEINVDEVENELLEKFAVQNVPLLLFFNEGLQVGREVGNIPKNLFLEKLNELK